MPLILQLNHKLFLWSLQVKGYCNKRYYEAVHTNNRIILSRRVSISKVPVRELAMELKLTIDI